MDSPGQPTAPKTAQQSVEVPLETPVDPHSSRKTTMVLNLQPLKEPRGFIRVLQFVFSIFCFSTTAGFWTDVRFVDQPCYGTMAEQRLKFTYPFRLMYMTLSNSCFKLVGDFAAQSQFFVATGVLTFLFCIAITAIYVLFDSLYQNNALIPIVDLVVTAVLTLFWLIASSVWAQGVSDFKYFSNPDTFLINQPSCLTPGNDLNMTVCYSTYSGSFATLNVSLIFGFLNFSLWAASIWFILKETEWFKRQQGNSTA